MAECNCEACQIEQKSLVEQYAYYYGICKISMIANQVLEMLNIKPDYQKEFNVDKINDLACYVDNLLDNLDKLADLYHKDQSLAQWVYIADKTLSVEKQMQMELDAIMAKPNNEQFAYYYAVCKACVVILDLLKECGIEPDFEHMNTETDRDSVLNRLACFLNSHLHLFNCMDKIAESDPSFEKWLILDEEDKK